MGHLWCSQEKEQLIDSAPKEICQNLKGRESKEDRQIRNEDISWNVRRRETKKDGER